MILKVSRNRDTAEASPASVRSPAVIALTRAPGLMAERYLNPASASFQIRENSASGAWPRRDDNLPPRQAYERAREPSSVRIVREKSFSAMRERNAVS